MSRSEAPSHDAAKRRHPEPVDLRIYKKGNAQCHRRSHDGHRHADRTVQRPAPSRRESPHKQGPRPVKQRRDDPADERRRSCEQTDRHYPSETRRNELRCNQTDRRSPEQMYARRSAILAEKIPERSGQAADLAPKSFLPDGAPVANECEQNCASEHPKQRTGNDIALTRGDTTGRLLIAVIPKCQQEEIRCIAENRSKQRGEERLRDIRFQPRRHTARKSREICGNRDPLLRCSPRIHWLSATGSTITKLLRDCRSVSTYNWYIPG
jgi:hypothetical protein